MEMLIIASQYLKRTCVADPHARQPSGFGRLLTATAIIGLGLIALQSAVDDREGGYGLKTIAFAVSQTPK